MSRPLGAIWQSQGNNLVISGELDILNNDQGTIDTSDSIVTDARSDAVGRGFTRVSHCGGCDEVVRYMVLAGGSDYREMSIAASAWATSAWQYYVIFNTSPHHHLKV